MPAGFSKRRKWLRVLIAAVLVGFVAIATLPWWFPRVLEPLAKRWGARYTAYHREGYQRFRLDGLEYTDRSGSLRAKRLEAYVPTVWIWHRVFGTSSAPFLQVDSWSWQVAASNAPAPPASAASVYTEFAKAGRTTATLARWLPRAEFSHGAVHLKDQTIEIPNLTWSEGQLAAQVTLPRYGQSFTLGAVTTPLAPWKVDVAAPGLELRSRFSIAATDQHVKLEGAAFWLTNRIDLNAAFPRHGFLPETASVRADAFSIPAERLRLEKYRNLTGSLEVDWSSNRFALRLSAHALARRLAYLPPIDVQARLSGDTNSAQVDVASISAPWLKAELTRPVHVSFRPPFLSQPTALDLTADLDQQPWLAARGRLVGQAMLRPSGGRFPQVDFTLAGSDVVVSNVAAKTLRLEGQLSWPRIRLLRGDAEMNDGSTVSLAGTFDVDQKTVQRGQLEFSGGFGRQYLPEHVTFRSASVSADFSGPLHALTNAGRIRLEDLRLPRANPLRLEAEWQGQGLDLKQVQLAVTAGNSSLQARGSAALEGSTKVVRLTALDLSRSNRLELQLQQPFEIQFHGRAPSPHSPDASKSASPGNKEKPPPPQPPNNSSKPQITPPAGPMLTVQSLDWSAAGRRLQFGAELTWPQTGSVHLSAEGLDSRLVADFLRGGTPDVAINHLEFSGGWTNSPLAFRIESEAELKGQEPLSFAARAAITGGAAGLMIERLSVSSATQTVCQAEGSLPVLIEPANTNGLIQIAPQGGLRVRLATEPDTGFWTNLAAITGVLLQQPALTADLQGTWAAPEGRIALQVQRVQFPRVAHPLPEIGDVDLTAEVTPEAARLSRLDVSIAGQPVRLSAEMPLTDQFWTNLPGLRRWPDWREATAHLNIDNAQLAPFTGLLPNLFGPEGHLSADVTLEPGASLKGRLILKGVGTRPLPDVGPLRDIEAVAVLDGRTVELTNFSADVGGQRVTADGRMELSEQMWSKHGLPPFEIHLYGTNVPIVRKPSLMFRANLDLGVTNSAASAPEIAGSVKLRKSLYLADLQSLVPERTASPKQRPPYFSIPASPWAEWRLQLNVQGDSFLRVQTPLFQGDISATLKLQGTLKDPILLGEVRISSGTVTFPFGSLDVKQGFVSLSSDNPFHPQLFVTAGTQRYGYNVKLEITGPADAPVVQFSSSPPLSSEQIVLMLTTGQAPLGTGISSSTGQQASGLALFLGKNALSEFGLGPTGAERLTLRSGQQVSQSGHPTYEVDYRISKRWSIVGQYDQFDQYNINLKWTVYSK